jgi:uncharacterized membrane protein
VFTIEVVTAASAPREAVFAYLADFRNAPKWQKELESVRLDDGPFPIGRKVVETRRFLNLRIDAPGLLVDWQPPESFTVRGSSGPLAVESKYSCREAPGGTQVTLQLTMTPHGPASLIEPVLRSAMRRQLAEAFERLGELLQQELATS